MLFRRKFIKKIEELKKSFGETKDEHFDFEQIETYHELVGVKGELFDVSDATWHDLDMDLYFQKIDRTRSKIGQQYLYHKLRSIDFNQEESERTEELIKELESDEETLFQIQYWLDKLNIFNVYHLPNLFLGKHIPLPNYFFIIPILSGTALLSLIFGFFNPSIFILLLLLFPINAVVHYMNKKRVNIYIQSIPLLLTMNKVAKELQKFNVIRNIKGDLTSPIKSIDKIKQRIAVFKLEQKIESDLEVIYWFLLEIIKITFLLEPLLLFNVVDRLKTKKSDIKKVYEYLGSVDKIQSTISLRRSYSEYCIPNFSVDAGTLSLENITHPLVSECVPNSINLQDSSCLLTGSNMAGKTTFIRAIGLSYITGIVLNTSFAKSFCVPLMRLKSIIRIEDDISASSSYFFQEVTAMKNIINDCTTKQPQLILLDELFKGTNTKERISSAKAILSYLKTNNCIVFVATHDTELTDLLKNEYDLYYFSESIENDQVIFDYKLKSGVPSAGNAISILNLNNYPTAIVNEASDLVKKL